MTSHTINAALRAFLREVIESYEQLEILIVLYNSGGAPWSAEAVSNALNLPEAVAVQVLEELRRLNVCAAQGQPAHNYRYAPPSPATAAVIADLAKAYETDRLGIIHLMNENAIERVRSKAARLFADAFIVGKKKD